MSQINVNTIRNRTGGDPSFDKGISITGLATASQFSGPITGTAATITGAISAATGSVTGQCSLANVSVSAATTISGTLTASSHVFGSEYGQINSSGSVVGIASTA